MPLVSTGQITIIDYNDAITLTGFITANQPKSQTYNPDNNTYSPNWASTNLVLTPSLFKAGSSTDIITDAGVQSIKWYDGAAPSTQLVTDANYTVGSTGAKPLTIKTNLTTKSSLDIICEIVYRDPTTSLDVTVKVDITLQKVVSGGALVDAVAWAPKGNIFKNSSPATLDLECDLYRGSVVDTTSVTYQWYLQDGVAADTGGGAGWKKLTDTANTYTGCTSRKLVIYPAAVAGMQQFKCVIKDTDTASPSYNQSFSDTVTVVDQSDPIQVVIHSTGGTTFKNGVGTSTLTAKLFQAGTEIDASGTGGYTYKWFNYKSDGTLLTGWGGATDYKTGKSITINDTDVTVKNTFTCEVSK
jgi:hypothetical protein